MSINSLIICLMIKLVVGSWVDPYEMNTNAKQKYTKPSLEKSASVSSVISHNQDSQVYQLYLKRLTSLIANAAHIHENDNGIYDGHIRFVIDKEDWQFLTRFSKNDITLDNLRKLDTIFSDSFKKSLIDDYMDTFEWYQAKLYSLIVNVSNLWIIGSLFIVHIVYQLLKNGFSVGYIIKYLVFVVFVWDFAIRYQTLIAQVEEHNSHVIYSKQCDTSKMSWKEYSKFILSFTNCETKSVTPLDVFLLQIKQLIIVPLRALGTGMGGFGREIFTTLPWGLNLVLWPVMLLFVVILAIFMMVFATGYSIDFNVLHLFKISLGKPSKPIINLTRGPKNRLESDSAQRSMIQEVSTSDEKKSDRVVKQLTTKVRDSNKSKKSVKSEYKQKSPTNKDQDEIVSVSNEIKEGHDNTETVNDKTISKHNNESVKLQ